MKKFAEQWRGFFRHITVLLLLSCLGGQPALAQKRSKIFVVKTKGIASYNQAIDGFRHSASTGWRIVEYDLGGTLEDTDGMLKRLKQENPDLVVAVGTKALSALIRTRVSLPIVFCMVLDHTRHNFQNCDATGVSLTISPQERLEVLTSLSPRIKKVGVLMRKQASPETLNHITELARERKVKIIPIELASEKEIPRKLRPALSRIDAIWMLDDAFIHSKESLEFVVLSSIENNLVFMATTKAFVKEGALISLSSSFFGNGRQAAQLAQEILEKGSNPRDIPVSFHIECDLAVNLKIARKINLTIPPEVLDRAERIYD